MLKSGSWKRVAIQTRNIDLDMKITRHVNFAKTKSVTCSQQKKPQVDEINLLLDKYHERAAYFLEFATNVLDVPRDCSSTHHLSVATVRSAITRDDFANTLDVQLQICLDCLLLDRLVQSDVLTANAKAIEFEVQTNDIVKLATLASHNTMHSNELIPVHTLAPMFLEKQKSTIKYRLEH